jgi:hypothetical protein
VMNAPDYTLIAEEVFVAAPPPHGEKGGGYNGRIAVTHWSLMSKQRKRLLATQNAGVRYGKGTMILLRNNIMAKKIGFSQFDYEEF